MALMLSVKEAAENLGFTEPAVRALVARRLIRHLRRGKRGRIYFRAEWLEEFIEQNTIEPNPPGVAAPRRRIGLAPRKLSTPGFDWALMGHGGRSRPRTGQSS